MSDATNGPVLHPASAAALAGQLVAVRSRYHRDILIFAAASLLPIALSLMATDRLALMVAVDTALGLTTIAVILVILAVSALLWYRAPDVGRIARRADRQLDNKERLSSAQSLLEMTSERMGPLGPSLLEDALKHSQGLSRFRIAIPLGVMAVSAVAVLSLSTAIVLDTRGQATLPDTATSELPPADNLSSDQVEQLLDLVRADAERLDNPYLEAVANSLEQFAQAASDMAPADRAERLEALMEHAAAAYGSSRPGWLPPDVGNLSALSAGLERQASSAMFATNSPMVDSVPLPDEWDPNAADPSLRSPESLQEFLAQSGAGAPAGPLLASESSSQFGASIPSLDEFKPRQLDPEKLLAASPAGASMNAEAGASSSAGMGTQRQGDAPDQETQPGFGAEMTLAAETTRPGNLIRIEVAPEVAYSDVDGAALPGSGIGAHNAPLQPVFRTVVQPGDQPVVARFFVDGDRPVSSGL